MTLKQYYTDTLSARKLERCYEIASPRIRQYLKAEIDYVVSSLNPSDMVLELGCGYGRVLRILQETTCRSIGIDTSSGSLQYGLTTSQRSGASHFIQMDAGMTGFQNRSFDVVVCIQNGISAFKVDPSVLVRESLRVTKLEGKCLFSTYSDKIWEERLQWFELQADEKLLGEIDWKATKRGKIVCTDGFVSTTFTEDDFHTVARKLGVICEVIEIDASSLFGVFTSS